MPRTILLATESVARGPYGRLVAWEATAVSLNLNHLSDDNQSLEAAMRLTANQRGVFVAMVLVVVVIVTSGLVASGSRAPSALGPRHVPNLVGLSVTRASRVLVNEGLGYRLSSLSYGCGLAPVAGVVQSQSPRPGVNVTSGSVVVVTAYRLPTLRHFTRAQAKHVHVCA